MHSYAATFLMVAVILGVLGFTNLMGSYAYGAKVVALTFVVLGLAAFAVEKKHQTTS